MRGLLSVTTVYFFFQAEDGIRDLTVTGVQTCALPISHRERPGLAGLRHADHAHERRRADLHAHRRQRLRRDRRHDRHARHRHRSEEHTSELQSQSNLVCRLLLEQKNLTWTSPSSTLLT